jgi:hypothetical protein
MLLNYHIRRFVLGLLCVGGCASACSPDTTQAQLHATSNTQQTKNETTNVVIQQHSRKLLMVGIVMLETC